MAVCSLSDNEYDTTPITIDERGIRQARKHADALGTHAVRRGDQRMRVEVCGKRVLAGR